MHSERLKKALSLQVSGRSVPLKPAGVVILMVDAAAPTGSVQ